jgi:hypothetical protein
MKVVRIAVVALVLGGVTAIVACGGDKKVNYVYLDAATTTAGDGAAQTTCKPADVPPFTFKAPGKFLGKCTNDQITQMLEACVFGTGGQPSSAELCAAARQNLGDCASCLIGGPSDPVAHPLMQYDPSAAAIASEGVCMTAITSDPTLENCALAFGQMETCTFASCMTPCLDDDNDQDFTACLQAAVGTTCTTGLTTFNSDACVAAYKGTQYGFCTSAQVNNQDITNLQYFTLIAQGICGSPPADAGAPADAGPDAAK